MRIAMLGTGPVGKSLAARLVGLGHDVRVGTRDPEVTLARTEPDSFGNPPFSAWFEDHPQVAVTTLAEAASWAELVVNATNGVGSLEALAAAGADNLAGKVLLDVTNPLDFSQGLPPVLQISNTDSLGELIQRTFPEARVVKTLNTVNAYLIAHPEQLAGGDHSLFLSGDDDAAKKEVLALLTSFGWSNVIDLGDISTARGTEMYLPLWARIYGLGSPAFNVKIVR
jgi:predicted dinucleotide-binding enzyme